MSFKMSYKTIPSNTMFECTFDGKIRKRGTYLDKECNAIKNGRNVTQCFGKKYFLDKLIAETWVKNPNNYKYVIHIDGNKLNNNASNLRWSATPYFRMSNPKTGDHCDFWGYTP